MAQHTTVSYLDDIDGTKAAETVSFALDGAQYEIDLNAKNAKNLRKAVAEFVDAGRKIKGPMAIGRVASRSTNRKVSSVSAPSEKRTDKSELTAIRTWAAENNVIVAVRGRISASVKEQYASAHAAA